MLQRSPTYVVSLPSRDGIAEWLRRRLPTHGRLPGGALEERGVDDAQLPAQPPAAQPDEGDHPPRRRSASSPTATTSTPISGLTYNPWDQRLCVAPDGDLFAAVSAGRASIVTDEVETFTERGLKLRSGAELEADVIVTATGLQMLAMGGVSLAVDGAPVHFPDHVVYKGMMLSGVPNFAFTVGYTNASWTLKADLTAAYVCRLLNHMRRHGFVRCMPADVAPGLIREPLLNLSSGYVLRSVQDFPSQGSKRPWRVHQNYALDLLDFKLGGVNDGVMRFDRDGAIPGTSASPGAGQAQPALSG